MRPYLHARTDHLGGLWIHQSALSQLVPGQRLDWDPTTGVLASVGQVGRMPQGEDAVSIIEENPGNRIQYGYDRRSGILLFVSVHNRFLNTLLQVQMSHRE